MLTVKLGALIMYAACGALLAGPGALAGHANAAVAAALDTAAARLDTAVISADTASARRDTASARPGGSAVPADSAAARRGSLWTMDELKGLLGAQTGEGASKASSTKRGRVAMLCALLVPGLGQMYNEKPLKAAVALGVETVYLSNILHYYRLAERREDERDRYAPGSFKWRAQDAWVNEYNARVTDWIWWSGGALLIIMLDAYVDAHLGDMKVSLEGGASDGIGGVQVVIRF